MTFVPFSGARLYSAGDFSVSERAGMYTLHIPAACGAGLFSIIDECAAPVVYADGGKAEDLRGNAALQQAVLAAHGDGFCVRADSTADAMKLLRYMMARIRNTAAGSGEKRAAFSPAADRFAAGFARA